MKKRILFSLILVLAASTVIMTSGVQTSPVNVTDIPYDGDVWNTGVLNNDNVWVNVHDISGGNTQRGFIEFNTSSISDTATVLSVELEMYAHKENAATDGVKVSQMSFQPLVRTPAQIYTDANDGNNYGTFPGLALNASYRMNLGTDAVTDMTALLASDWFAVGFQAKTQDEDIEYWANNYTEVAPVLYVGTDAGNYTFVLDGVYFENGTRTDDLIVTISSPDDIYTQLVNGPIGVGFSELPSLIFWDIGTGVTRKIRTPVSENFTVTVPDLTFDTFVFTARDFTGKTALGSAYLEAWRIINSTDTLIERNVIDIHNEIPMNLVLGATYTIRVRFYDNSTFTWGQFVPGETTTFTLVLRGVEITEQAYLVGNFLNVEITRPITTQITVDYLTSRNTTVWSNITVLIRNGAVIATQSYSVESFTYNLAGLDANTSYTVLVEGEHSLQTEWAYSRSFDGTETYPDIPNIENIFPMGALDGSNLIAWVFVLASGLVFSVIYKRASLIVMCAMASFFSAFGFTDWSIELLALNWFFAIVVYLGSGDR